MPNLLRFLRPRTLRSRLMLAMVPIVGLTMLGGGYLLSFNSKEALLQEKRSHLLGITRVLLAELEQQGGYAGLETAATESERSQRIHLLNQRLSALTDRVASAFPGVGIGYYHRELDAIITYGPSREFADKVGISIGPQHPGRQVMASGQTSVSSGRQVRGEIMNAMTPISVHGEVVGYIWANELLADIEGQVAHMRSTTFAYALLGLALALLSIYFVVRRLTHDIAVIKDGLQAMSGDLTARIPPLRGESGDLAQAINTLAASLADSRTREMSAVQQALEHSEETLKTAIDAIDAAFVLFDADDRLLYCNQKYRELFPAIASHLDQGNTYPQMLKRGVEAGVFPQANRDQETWIRQRLAEHLTGHGIREEQIDNGRWLRFIDRRTSQGHFVGLRVDITDLQRARKAAEEASETKNQFLATMSHEIRTPMNGVLGMTELLLTTELSQEQREFAETAAHSARALLGLINDILDFSKIEAGRLDIEQIPFDPVELAEEIAELLAFMADEKGVELVAAIAPETPRQLVGDPGRLRQILLNLLGNAVKFTPAGDVQLRIEPLPAIASGLPRLRFEIIDTGIGIAPEKLGNLFQPFTQADSSTTRQFGGTGLGLSIAKRLVELMGGRIGVSSAPGQGSCFWFELPFAGAASAEPTTVDLGHRHFLLLDGNPHSREFMTRVLRKAGGAVIACPDLASFQQALHAPERPALSALLLDWRQLGPRPLPPSQEIPCILIAPVGLRSSWSEQIAAGFHDCLHKPVRARQLLQAVQLSERPAPSGNPMLPNPATVSAPASGRLLLVEDNPVNQKVALTLLRRLGYTVDVAEDGRIGIECLARNDYDLVLMDCRMPVMDGYAASAAIRSGAAQVRRPDIPIIAMTANAMEGDREAALAAGMNDYLTKPINPQLLASTIQRWLNQERAPIVSAPPSAAPSRWFNPEQILEQLDGDQEIAREILGEMSHALAAELSQCQGACAQQPIAYETAERAAHTLKGLCAQAGSEQLHADSLALEIALRQRDPATIPRHLATIAANLPQLQQQIRNWLQQAR